MNTSSPTLPFPSRATAAPTRRVIDAPMRMFHWLFALCFVGAYASADGEHWRMLHVTLGYTLAGLLAFRLVYGLVGPRQARLALLGRRLGGLSGWVSSLRTSTPGNLNWRKGQNLLMALALVALLAAVVPVTLSGYAIYNDFGGEWLEELHELRRRSLPVAGTEPPRTASGPECAAAQEPGAADAERAYRRRGNGPRKTQSRCSGNVVAERGAGLHGRAVATKPQGPAARLCLDDLARSRT